MLPFPRTIRCPDPGCDFHLVVTRSFRPKCASCGHYMNPSDDIRVWYNTFIKPPAFNITHGHEFLCAVCDEILWKPRLKEALT